MSVSAKHSSTLLIIRNSHFTRKIQINTIENLKSLKRQGCWTKIKQKFHKTKLVLLHGKCKLSKLFKVTSTNQ